MELLSPGQRVLDRYIVQRTLGAGGMGQVYLGVHDRLGFPVALKVLLKLQGDLVARFEREANLMARLRHPNIVSILDYGFVGPLPCIAMEYVEGETLDHRIDTRRALPWPEAVEIVLGILSGLEPIHRANILHRDLKPANVMITRDQPEIVKLLDFGIAKSIDPEAEKFTAVGAVVGTPLYMPPEQILSFPLDARSDLYTAGMIAYVLVAGELPFARNPRAYMERLTKAIPPPPDRPDRPPLPVELKTAILRALAPDANQRPESATAFKAELAAILGGARGAWGGPAARPSGAHGAPPAGPSAPYRAPMAGPSAPTAAPPYHPPAADLTGGLDSTHVRPRAPTGAPLPAPTHGTLARETHSGELDSTFIRSGPPAGTAVAGAPFTAIIAARLPPSRLALAEERQWLGGLVVPARGYVIGGIFWFCVRAHASREDAERAAKRVEERIFERFGAAAKVGSSMVGEPLQLSASMLSGGALLPAPLQALLESLGS